MGVYAPGEYDLPEYNFRFPDTINWQDSHGVGALGVETATWVYSFVGSYLLEFWVYVLPFFIALFLFWKILGYFLGPVEKLDAGFAAQEEAQRAVWGANSGYVGSTGGGHWSRR